MIEVEPINYTLSHVQSGILRHEDDDVNRVQAHLFTDGNLWTVVIEESGMMSIKPTYYRAIDEIRHQAVMKACIRANQAAASRSFNVYQIYEALGIQLDAGGTVAE